MQKALNPIHTYLNTSWPPWDELGQFPLPESLQTLVHLSWVHLPLDDVQQGDVAVVVRSVSWCGHHDVLGLENRVT